MTHRMFVAVVPPEAVREDLAEFLAPRHGMPWIDPEQWHLTLAFLQSVPEHRVDDLVDALERVAARHDAFDLALAGAGAFPDPLAARVLWAAPTVDLTALATSCRGAANSVGATPDGMRFVGHLSLAKLRRKQDVRKWLQVLDTYRSPTWRVEGIELVESRVGEGPHGRPRYDTVAALPLRP